MNRALRFFCTATAMLCVTVGICYIFRDDTPTAKTAGLEISGRLAGLGEPTAAQSNPDNSPTPTVQEQEDVPEGKSSVPVSSSSSLGSDEESVSANVPGSEPQEKSGADAAESEEIPAGMAYREVADSLRESGESAVQKTENEDSAASPSVTAEAEKSTQAAEQSSPHRVTSAQFVMQGSLIKLVLHGDAPMKGQYFILKDPERVVLDLNGAWRIDVPRVPGNRLIKAVRVGYYSEKTRLVFDMKTRGKVSLVPLDQNALELHIR